MFKFTKIELVIVTVIILITVFGIRSCLNRNQMMIGTVKTVDANSVETVRLEETLAQVAQETNITKTVTNTTNVSVEYRFRPKMVDR